MPGDFTGVWEQNKTNTTKTEVRFKYWDIKFYDL